MISRYTGNSDLHNKSGDSDPVLDSPCPWNIYLYINLYPIINYKLLTQILSWIILALGIFIFIFIIYYELWKDYKPGASDPILDNPCPWNLGACQQKLLPWPPGPGRCKNYFTFFYFKNYFRIFLGQADVRIISHF